MKTVIVAGITRSGMTLTMQMLQAGGYPCFGTYPAFEDYTLGEMPFDKIIGKAVKLVDTQMQFPPPGEYYVIRLKRNQKQQTKSMCKMIRTLMNIEIASSDARRLEKSLSADYAKIDVWAKRQKGLLVLDFEELILKPESAAHKIQSFVELPLNINKMVACVIQRNTDCYPTMLEAKFIA